MKIRPIVPLSQQQPGQVAAKTGIELYTPNNIRYYGVYYTVSGQYITTPSYTDTTVVLRTRPVTTTGNDVYDRVKNGNVTNKFVQPIHFIPTITDEDLTTGYIQRYFVTKRNEPNVFIEISNTQYSKYDIANQEVIDANIWKRFNLRWLINGEKTYVMETNRKTIVIYEREDGLYGLSKFLFKLDEFYLGKR
jgi:hypothetical protein